MHDQEQLNSEDNTESSGRFVRILMWGGIAFMLLIAILTNLDVL